jgi:hypothetical protein
VLASRATTTSLLDDDNDNDNKPVWPTCHWVIIGFGPYTPYDRWVLASRAATTTGARLIIGFGPYTPYDHWVLASRAATTTTTGARPIIPKS